MSSVSSTSTGGSFDPAIRRTSSSAGEAHAPSAGEAREIDLFRRAQTGDRGAFGQLAIRTQDRLYNAILRVVGDREEARELTQETFVKALIKIDGFRGESQPFTWLFRIGVNLAISHLRKVQRRRTFSLDASRPGRTGNEDQASALVERISSNGLSGNSQEQPSDLMEQRETQQLVLTALGKLEPEYRAILVMRDMEDMDYQAIADVFDWPLGTLKSRLFRARLALRDQLAKVMKA